VTQVLIYLPVIHAGYHRFLAEHDAASAVTSAYLPAQGPCR